MRFWTAYALLALGSLVTKAMAADHGAGPSHHGHLTDLIAPFVNVAILIGFLVWKVRGPLRDYFQSKSEEVANTLERVSLKSKEAKIMLEAEQRKASNLNNEIKAIQQQAESDVLAFEKNISRETEDKTQKLKADANLKLHADKKSAMDDLNSELLNEVVKKAKSTIKGNKDYQNKVSSKLLQGL